MAWATPEYSRKAVDAAGKVIVDPKATPQARADALVIVNNWRAAHGFPLNTFQVRLRDRGRRIDGNCIVAQRIKRLASIESKLLRPDINMPLSRMQDIGGCRAIVDTVSRVYELLNGYCNADIKHKRIKITDYIETPKSSGYRSVHLIYRYYSDRKETYNNLQVELQIRSVMQHTWATAVETVGTFTRQSLKSSQGEGDWLRFFALMGSAIAYLEGKPLVPGTPENIYQTHGELRRLARQLDVQQRLDAYTFAVNAAENPLPPNVHFFLLDSNPSKGSVQIYGYARNQLEQAQQHYTELERDEEIDAVLVSVDSVSQLKRAYPNYYADTSAFVDLLGKILNL